MDATTLFLGVIFGSLGMGYIVYGRKQKNGIVLIAGVALCVLPYILSNIFLVILAGIAAAAIPFVLPH